MSASASTSRRPPFLAFVSNDKDLAALRGFAASQGFGEESVLKGDIATATEYLAHKPSPDVLVVEIASAEAAPGLLDKLADVCDPGTKVVVSGTINQYSFYVWLTEIGIFSYLLQPLNEQALQSMWAKATEPPPQAGSATREPGKIVGVLGARGGSGGTSVAVLLAGILAERGDKSVALVDLDPQDGSIALFLDLEPSRGFREALEKPDRIDMLFLDRVMVKARDHLHILSTEEPLGEQILPQDGAEKILIKTLREKFDVVLLDLPRNLNGFVRGCLRECDQTVVVSEPTLQGLRDAMRYHDLFRESLKVKPPLFALNRVGFAPKYEVGVSDYEKSLGTKVEHRVPFAPDIFMNITPDLSVLKQAQNPALKALHALAGRIIPQEAADEKAGKKPKFGLLKKK